MPSPNGIARDLGPVLAAPTGGSPYHPPPERADRRSQDVAVSVLLFLMELLPAFIALIASRVLAAAGLPFSVFWLLLISGLFGIVIVNLLGGIGSARPWKFFVVSAAGVMAAASMARLSAHDWIGVSVAALLVAAAYWRGIVVGSQLPTHESAEQRTGFGFALVFLGLLLILGRGSSFQHSLWPMLALSGIAFALSSMWALALIKADWTQPTGAAAALVLSAGVPLTCLLVLSVGTLELLSLNVTGWLFSVVGRFGLLTQTLQTGILAVITAVFDANARLVDALLRFVHNHQHPLHLAPPSFPLGHRPRHVPFPSGSIGWFAFALAAGLTVLVLAAIAYIVWRALSNWRSHRRVKAISRQRGKHVWSRSRFWRGLGTWIRELFGRGTELTGQTLRAARRRVSGVDYPDDPVRRVYSRLLQRATRAGLLRAASTTPEEFLRQLESRWPEGSEHFAALTRAYMLRRYGEVILAADQLAEIDRHWQRARILVRPPSRGSQETVSG